MQANTRKTLKICADACLWEVEEVDWMGKIDRKQRIATATMPDLPFNDSSSALQSGPARTHEISLVKLSQG